MRSFPHVLRVMAFIALLAVEAVQAQSFCGPNGVNAYGMACDPNQLGMGGGQQQGSQSATYPAQLQPITPPVITNRPPSGIAQPGFPQSSLSVQPRFGLPDAVLPQAAPRERNQFQDFVMQSVGRDLPMFGYNLFQNVPSTFAPLDRVPVTPDYVIGPDDELLIRAWGQVDIDYRVVVDRDGSISIPRVGNINVAGIRFQDLQRYLKTAIGRVFRNFDLSVAMGQLRSIQVFVVGHATRPGTYTVSSLSTLVNALFVSGGPTPRGSMRNIQLKRGGKLVTEFDVYDLLLKGDKSKDVRLLPGDVIYIPPAGQLVAIAGSVNTPAIYELKGDGTLARLIELAGGLAVTAAGQKVTVERIADRKTRQVDEFRLDKEGLAHSVRDGDIVQVLPLSPRFENAVTVRGNVALPARHSWRPGIRVKDVVPDKDALIVPDYWIKRNLMVRPDLTGRDYYGQSGAPTIDQLQATGWQPGTSGSYRAPDGQTWRIDPTGRATRQEFSAQRQGEGFGQFVQGEPGMQGRQGEQGVQGRQGEGGVQGAQGRQGEQGVQSRQGEPGTRRDLVTEHRPRNEIKHTLPELNWDYAVVERLNLSDLTTTLIPFNLGKAVLEGDPQNNLVLEPGDVITIFSKDDIQVPVTKQTKFVRLEGEIATPGVYQVLSGETLRQLVARVGGFSRSAYLYGAEFTRESVRIQQQKRLDEALDRLAQEVERNAAAKAQSGLETDSAQAAAAQADSQRRLLARMREIRASGRVVLDIPPNKIELRNVPDLVLEDGDRFLVPAQPSTVGIVGAVYNQNIFIHDPGKRVSDYLAQAGGATRDADTARMYVVRADGSVTGRAQSSIFTAFSSERLMPGDTIVVPENLDRFRLTKELKDWSQIFYQFALGVAGLRVLQGL